jgi:hypothetical protein
LLKPFSIFVVSASLLAAVHSASAVQLSTNTRTLIPHSVQQVIVVDYRAMQNSQVAIDLKANVLPSELKGFDELLSKSKINENHDVDLLAFARFRTSDASDKLLTVGVVQGRFSLQEIQTNFRKQKLKPTVLRTNNLYPMNRTGMMACFVDPSTLVFGSIEAVTKALEARDGQTPNLLTNATMMDAMRTVDSAPLWSVLDQKGTQAMVKQILGEAGYISYFDSVRKRLVASWYTMNFQYGVKFDLTLSTGDSFTAMTLSSLLNAAMMVRKISSGEFGKQVLNATEIKSNSGKLTIHCSTSNSAFSILSQLPHFQSMVR